MRKFRNAADLPLVSIVTPSYNKGRFIEETILSIKNQDYPNIEHIIVDGGSTDNTLDIIKKWESSYNMRWISELDKGQSDAINKGWRMAKGEILAYLNADDTYMPWAVKTAVKFFAEHPDVSMVYGDCNIINEHSEMIIRGVGEEFDLGEMLCGPGKVPQPAVFVRKEVLNEIGYFDTNLHYAMDHDLWIRIGLRLKIEHISRLLANFRRCSGTKSVDEEYKFGDDRLYILDKFFSNRELPKEVRVLKRRAYSYAHLRAGSGRLKQRQRGKAGKHLIKAFILYPQQLMKSMAISLLITFFLGRRATDIAVNWKSKNWRQTRKSEEGINGGKITVYMDSSNSIFFSRLKNLVSESGVKVEEVALPEKKTDVLRGAWRLKRAEPKIVHYLWGSSHPLIYIIPKLLRKKVIIHWIGTDVLHVTSMKEGIFDTLLRKIAYKMVDLHLVEFEPLASELRPLGIEAKVIPLMPDMPLLQEDITWPSKDAVLVYLPERRPEFYGSSIVFRLAEELPEIKFLIVAHAGEGAPQLPNVKYLGWVNDMEGVWEQVKVYLRLTKHDGLSHTVIEALARGKHVIRSREFPYCRQARTFKEAKDALKDILRQNQPNIEGMHYVRSQFEPSKIAQEYRNIYLKLLS